MLRWIRVTIRRRRAGFWIMGPDGTMIHEPGTTDEATPPVMSPKIGDLWSNSGGAGDAGTKDQS